MGDKEPQGPVSTFQPDLKVLEYNRNLIARLGWPSILGKDEAVAEVSCQWKTFGERNSPERGQLHLG